MCIIEWSNVLETLIGTVAGGLIAFLFGWLLYSLQAKDSTLARAQEHFLSAYRELEAASDLCRQASVAHRRLWILQQEPYAPNRKRDIDTEGPEVSARLTALLSTMHARIQGARLEFTLVDSELEFKYDLKRILDEKFALPEGSDDDLQIVEVQIRDAIEVLIPISKRLFAE